MVLMLFAFATLMTILPTAVAAPELSSHPPSGTAAVYRVRAGIRKQRGRGLKHVLMGWAGVRAWARLGLRLGWG